MVKIADTSFIAGVNEKLATVDIYDAGKKKVKSVITDVTTTVSNVRLDSTNREKIAVGVTDSKKNILDSFSERLDGFTKTLSDEIRNSLSSKEELLAKMSSESDFITMNYEGELIQISSQDVGELDLVNSLALIDDSQATIVDIAAESTIKSDLVDRLLSKGINGVAVEYIDSIENAIVKDNVISNAISSASNFISTVKDNVSTVKDNVISNAISSASNFISTNETFKGLLVAGTCLTTIKVLLDKLLDKRRAKLKEPNLIKNVLSNYRLPRTNLILADEYTKLVEVLNDIDIDWASDIRNGESIGKIANFKYASKDAIFLFIAYPDSIYRDLALMAEAYPNTSMGNLLKVQYPKAGIAI